MFNPSKLHHYGLDFKVIRIRTGLFFCFFLTCFFQHILPMWISAMLWIRNYLFRIRIRILKSFTVNSVAGSGSDLLI